MIKKILSISGRPGLYRLVSQGKNMLIVESMQTGKRTPAYAHDKVVSLGDIAIYTPETDVPLTDVFESIKENTGGKEVEYKNMNDAELRELFAEYLPDFDRDRVYTNDIRKVFSWYNQLIAAGVTEFKENEIAEDQAAEAAEAADARSLAACEGAVLVVDAAQGIEAQTLANVYLALDDDLEIVPVINKIDLPSAEPERVRQEIEDVIGLDASEAVLASAKNTFRLRLRSSPLRKPRRRRP